MEFIVFTHSITHFITNLFCFLILELRQVTTMFLKLDSYNSVEHRDPLSLQSFFYLLQDVLEDSGGFLRQFLVDDKVRFEPLAHDIWTNRSMDIRLFHI